MPILDVGPNPGDGGEGGTCSPWCGPEDMWGPCADYEFDSAVIDDAIQLASDILYLLSGSRWPGECSDVVRPPAKCGCEDRCECGWISKWRLPGYPALHVDQVLVDGAIISPARYRIDNSAELVYLPNPADPSSPISGWPSRQRADYPTSAEGTWQVSYTFGGAPPVGGRRSAAALACQLALSWLPAGHPLKAQCQLPQRVTSVVRQNVTLAVLDPLTLFDEGKTGISMVDMWLASLRIGDARKPASAWVPGRRPGARRPTG